MSTLPVVVLPYAECDRPLAGRARVEEQSRRAREALSRAATIAGARLAELQKDGEEAPLPSNGWHWSLSHGRHFAAAALARAPLGIDLEEIRPRSQALVPRVTSRAELELLGGFDWCAFFRVWTAKEAVLKKAGVGILELSRCRLLAVPDARTLVLSHRGREHVVHQEFRADHVVSIAHDAPEAALEWHWSALARPLERA